MKRNPLSLGFHVYFFLFYKRKDYEGISFSTKDIDSSHRPSSDVGINYLFGGFLIIFPDHSAQRGQIMRTLTVSLMIVFLGSLAFAGESQKNYSFDQAMVTSADEYHRIFIQDLMLIGQPGDPALPTASYTVILPPGEELTGVQIVSENWIQLEGSYLPEPFAPQVPISSGIKPEAIPNAAVYNSDNIYPASPVSDIQTGFLRGYSIGTYLIHPVRWNPATGEAEQLVDVRVNIVSKPTDRAANALRLLRTDPATQKMVRDLTSDNVAVNQYVTEVDELDEIDPKFLIICDVSHENEWEEYAIYKRSRGLPTEVLNTMDIDATFTGVDLQEKIRNAIIDKYIFSGIEHVLLGGDVAYVPHRELRCVSWVGQGAEEDDIPADLYYAGLDGDWNDDGDQLWGEYSVWNDESDLYQEVTIGRAPVNTTAQLESWIEKQILYQSEPVVDEVVNALMVGEYLGWNNTGGDYKDEVYMGSNAHGYTTAGFPENWDVNTLYDRDNGWNGWNLNALFSDLNSGVHMVNHLGHADVSYALKAFNSDITDFDLTNDGVTHSRYLLYTQGCYCGAFEQNSITEKWNSIDNGAFAVISNSRFGWGSGNNTDGASQRYDREFFDAIFDEDLTLIGEANRDSKHENIGVVNASCMRWCFYEINLFGDPTIDLYTDTPGVLEVELPDTYLLGQDYLTVTTPGLSWARVAVLMDDDLLGVGYTDYNGNANIPIELEDPGTITVNVIAHNYLPWTGDLLVINADGPYPTVAGCVIDDSESGNGNGNADFGEDIIINLEVVNLGQDEINNMEVVFESMDDCLVINEDTAIIPTLAPDGTTIVEFPASVAVDVEDELDVPIHVTFNAGDDSWDRDISVEMHAPVLTASIAYANDVLTGNGNHRLDPGETASVVLSLTNEGTADLSSSLLDVYCDNPHVTAIEILEETVAVNSGETTTYNNGFSVTIDEETPDPYRLTMMLILEREDGFRHQNFDLVSVGGFYDDSDGSPQNVEHYALGDGGDQWHISADRNWTDGGMFSWKIGGEGYGTEYDDNLDACLQLPPIPRSQPLTLSFRHWMEAEISVQWPGECYDGGRVEISPNGDLWIGLQMPGYNYTVRDGATELEGQMVYSGSIEWEEQSYTFQPGDEDDSLHVRFRFCSDQGTVREGWYLDDISISIGALRNSPHTLSGEVNGFGETELSWLTPDPELDQDFDLLGFYIYRNGEIVSDVVVDVTYSDPMYELPPDTYMYYVTAAYSNGESSQSNEIFVAWDGDVVTEDLELPIDWNLAQPYPNPFNPTTSITISVPEAADIKLDVYDLLGRQVAVLAAGQVTAGYHQFTVDAGNWASGLYFVKFETPAQSFVRKMVLVK